MNKAKPARDHTPERMFMHRNIIGVGGHDLLLAQNTDMDALKEATHIAMSSGGGFIDVTVVGNRHVSAYLTPGVAVIFDSHTVTFDDRDTGDIAFPFDDFDDFTL